MKVYVEKVSQSPTTPVQTVDYLISFTEMDKKGSCLSDVKLLKELELRAIEILKETRPELFESKKMNDINNQFLIELKDLLKKYNADISFSVGDGSDTHGLYDEKIVITINDKIIHENDGYGIAWYDIEY